MARGSRQPTQLWVSSACLPCGMERWWLVFTEENQPGTTAPLPLVLSTVPLVTSLLNPSWYLSAAARNNTSGIFHGIFHISPNGQFSRERWSIHCNSGNGKGLAIDAKWQLWSWSSPVILALSTYPEFMWFLFIFTLDFTALFKLKLFFF